MIPQAATAMPSAKTVVIVRPSETKNIFDRIQRTYDEAMLLDDGALEQLLWQIARVQHKAIEQRAYQIFLDRGGTHGQDLHDWLEAERLLVGSPRLNQ